jgi:hypothetical protein
MQQEIMATMDAVPSRATAVTVYIRGLIPLNDDWEGVVRGIPD